MAKSVFTGNYNGFRTLLIEARTSSGLTQIDLARKLGRPQSFVSKYERGERRLDVVEFLEVASAIRIAAPSIGKYNEIGTIKHVHSLRLKLSTISTRI